MPNRTVPVQLANRNGTTVYFVQIRHASTDHAAQDPPPPTWQQHHTRTIIHPRPGTPCPLPSDDPPRISSPPEATNIGS